MILFVYCSLDKLQDSGNSKIHDVLPSWEITVLIYSIFCLFWCMIFKNTKTVVIQRRVFIHCLAYFLVTLPLIWITAVTPCVVLMDMESEVLGFNFISATCLCTLGFAGKSLKMCFFTCVWRREPRLPGLSRCAMMWVINLDLLC